MRLFLLWKILYSPLLRREVQRLLRSKKSFFVFFILLLIVYGLLLVRWDYITNSISHHNFPAANRALFYTLSQIHLVFLLILTPFIFAPLIVEERRRGTLDLLLTSPLSIIHFVSAKWMAPFFYYAFVLVGTLPLLSLSLLGGGISVIEIIRVYALFVSVVLLGSGVGLLCSTLSPSMIRVYINTSLLMIILLVIIPFHKTILTYLSHVFFHHSAAFPKMGMDIFFYLFNPVFLLVNESNPSYLAFARIAYSGLEQNNDFGLFQISNKYLITHAFEFYIVFSFIVFIFCFLITYYRAAFLARKEERVRKSGKKERKSTNKVWAYLVRDLGTDLTRALDRYHEKSDSYLQRLQWFAKYNSLLRMGSWALIAGFLALPISITPYVFILLPLLLPVFFTFPLAASGISSEYEKNTLDLLKTTLLSPYHLVRSKLHIYHLYSVVLVFLFVLPGLITRILVHDSFENMMLPLVFFGISYLTLRLFTVISIYFSAATRRSHLALIWTILLYLVILFAPV